MAETVRLHIQKVLSYGALCFEQASRPAERFAAARTLRSATPHKNVELTATKKMLPWFSLVSRTEMVTGKRDGVIASAHRRVHNQTQGCKTTALTSPCRTMPFPISSFNEAAHHPEAHWQRRPFFCVQNERQNYRLADAITEIWSPSARIWG
jgi:hypothetical protein